MNIVHEAARPTSRSARGVTLLEALIALAVLAFGMLTFVALQAQLRMNADVSKQRSEAVRIAQEDIENFRSYGKLTSAADATRTGSLFSYEEVATATGQKASLTAVGQATNAVYTLTRTVTASTVADMKDVVVTVSWTDRSGTAQSVTLRTRIAESDPALAASLAIAPDGSPVRNALDRDIQVPLPAKNLGDGTSVIKPSSGSTIAYIFNNDTGLVTRRCESASNASVATNQFTTSTLASAGCTDIADGAYLVSGFVRFSTGNTPDEENANDVSPAGSSGSGGITVRMDLNGDVPPSGAVGAAALRGASGWPAITNGTSTMSPTGSYPALPECGAEALQTVIYDTPLSPPVTQVNDGITETFTETTVVAIIPQSLTIADTAEAKSAMAPFLGIPVAEASTRILNPSAPASPERYVGYACLVYPMATTTPRWYTGRVAIWPAGFTLGTSTSSEFKVCRYSSDYDLDGFVLSPSSAGSDVTAIDNTDHPYAYMQAAESLSNQNFLIIRARRTTGGGQAINCPTDASVEVDGRGGENYTDTGTVLHQP